MLNMRSSVSASCSCPTHPSFAPHYPTPPMRRLAAHLVTAARRAGSSTSSSLVVTPVAGSCFAFAPSTIRRWRCYSNDEAHAGAGTVAEQLGLSPSTSGSSLPAAAAVAASGAGEQETEYVVLNFYHLVDIPDPEEMVARHRAALADLDVKGRIWISAQGINTQAGGPAADVQRYADWVAAQPEFQGLRYTLWPAKGHTFPRLRLKHKPNLISLAGGMEGLPVTDPAARATPLEPGAWKAMLDSASADPAKQVVVLDVRNNYEWDAGHFAGAARPEEEVFAETPVGEGQLDVPAPLKEVAPDTPVMMYCTGGIRCDVYSAFLKQRGYNNLYTLEGGVQNYLANAGGDHWKGSLFVFDGRMAINPAVEGSAAAEGGEDPEQQQQQQMMQQQQREAQDAAALPAAVPCQLCGQAAALLPHMNCANVDCNELFIACAACKAKWKGCCCEACQNAPRLLRPLKMEGNYGSWGNYIDPEIAQAMFPRRTEGRVARRARRREASKARREAVMSEKRALKAAAKEAMARVEALKAAAAEQQQQQQQQPAAMAGR